MRAQTDINLRKAIKDNLSVFFTRQNSNYKHGNVTDEDVDNIVSDLMGDIKPLVVTSETLEKLRDKLKIERREAYTIYSENMKIKDDVIKESHDIIAKLRDTIATDKVNNILEVKLASSNKKIGLLKRIMYTLVEEI